MGAEGSTKKAIQKAMRLLVSKPRSEHELRERLAGEAYSREDIEAALAYVKSYGYINDRKYAENYAIYRSSSKSRNMIRTELRNKGVSEEDISLAMEEIPDQEASLIRELLYKKAGEPHVMDDKELNRVLGYLARRGFSQGDIWREIRAYKEQSLSSGE